MSDPSEARLVKRLSAFPTTAEEPPAEARLRTKVRLGFAVAIFLTCLLGFLSWRMAQQATDDAGWVAHTHKVSTALEGTLRHLLDVETGGRGFAVTGDDLYLEPYESGRPAVVQDLAELHHLLRDPGQVLRMKALEGQAIAEIRCMEEIVAVRQNSGKGSALTLLKQGKDMMDAARATVAEMEDTQELLLEQRTRRARAARYFNISVIVLGAILGGIFLSIAGATVSREIGISATARAQVISLNANLERRVQQRTTALQSEIANREEAEAALSESQSRLAGVIQSAMDAILTVDEEQRIVLFNGAAEKMFRCPASEALGQPITRFIPQRFHATHAGQLREFGETSITNRSMGQKNVLWAVRTDGQEFQIEASISQVKVSGKKLFTVIHRDVSERVRAEALRERWQRSSSPPTMPSSARLSTEPLAPGITAPKRCSATRQPRPWAKRCG